MLERVLQNLAATLHLPPGLVALIEILIDRRLPPTGARLVATCNVLSAFISEIREVSAKRLPPAKAAEFIASATGIRAAYGCR